MNVPRLFAIVFNKLTDCFNESQVNNILIIIVFFLIKKIILLNVLNVRFIVRPKITPKFIIEE